MKFYTGARVRWLSTGRPFGLDLRDLGEVTALADGDAAWVKFDKLDRSVRVPLRRMIVVRNAGV